TLVSVGPYQLCRGRLGRAWRQARRDGSGKASPAKMRARRRDWPRRGAKSWRATRAEGTEYQTEMRSFSIQSATALGKRAVTASKRQTAAPRLRLAQRSKMERSKWKGAWLATRSAGPRLIWSAAHSMKLRAWPWVSMTPLGTPVEPEV